MPTYEFRCNECGEEFEKFLRFSESAVIPACPKCASSQTQKKLSRVMALGGLSSGSESSSGGCAPRGGFS